MTLEADLKKNHGQFLKELRLGAGLSQQKAVDQLRELYSQGPSRSSWNGYEFGSHAINLLLIPHLSKMFKIAPSVMAWHFSELEYTGDGFTDIRSQISKSGYALEQEMTDRGLEPAKLLAYTMPDNSMVPEIKEGAQLLVEPGIPEIVKPTLLIIEGKGGTLLVRYVKPLMGDGYTIYCHDKVHEADQELDNLNKLTIIGKVVSYTHFL